ncbi:hypothetical protein CC80DRAFT_491396 [Byssothecium circinans]|uniref:Uncharacterized protein n=1 Tax=Byssothecium circinans TaxID=147558 RepID=A0A6A5U2N3_9PLEO|nr:hypothetical protein CC80DRAFT_491396 [Byssothecium circinans]
MKPKVDILVMETILDLGEIRIDSPYDNRTGDTVLSLAIRERRADIVRLLLNRGAPVNAPTPTGSAIFCCVADKDDKALSSEDTQVFMTLLLDKGATVDAQFNDGTAVKRACVVEMMAPAQRRCRKSKYLFRAWEYSQTPKSGSLEPRGESLVEDEPYGCAMVAARCRAARAAQCLPLAL